MSRPEAVLFDLDDTLYEEIAFVRQGFAAVADFLAPRLDAPAAELADRLVTLHERDGRGRLFDTLLDERTGDIDADLVAACLLVYRSAPRRLDPCAGAVAMLDALRAAGLRTGLVSDGLASVQRAKLGALPDIAARLDAVVLTDELGAGRAKPSPVPFRVAALLLGVAPSSMTYVANDPRKDFAGARAAGMSTVRTGRPPDEGGRASAAFDPSDDADRVVPDLVDVASAVLGARDD